MHSICMRYLRRVNIIETAGRMVVSRHWVEREIMSYCLIGIEFQFYKMKKGLKMDGGDRSTTLLIYLISLICTLKNG